MAIEKRKCCITCNKPLIAFNGHFLHIEEPCNGLLDYIEIEATISDEFLNEKFEKLYGKPEIDDYERIGVLEEEIWKQKNEIEFMERKLNKPLIKFLLKFFR